MKRTIIIFVTIFTALTSAFSVSFAGGIIGAASFNSVESKTTNTSGGITVTTELNANTIFGTEFGLAFELGFSKTFFIQQEVFFHLANGYKSTNTNTGVFSTTTSTQKSTFHSIEVPLLLKYKIPLNKKFKINVLAGPTFNFIVGGIKTDSHIETTISNNVTITDSSETKTLEESNFNIFALGMAVGAELSMRAGSGNLAIGFRYERDLTDLNSTEETKTFRVGFVPTISYMVSF